MPYIKQDDREKFKFILSDISSLGILTTGELNYLFSSIISEQMHKTGKSYSVYHRASGKC